MATLPPYNYNDEYYNYTDNWDWSNDCDLDCLWDRLRTSRLSVLRPLSVILALIGLVGIVGNILVILVFSRTVKKRTSTYLVLMLAIIDLIACSIVIPGTLLKEWLFKFKSDFICKLWELMRNSAIISSATILAAIAFDRFLLVYRKTHQDGNKHVTMAMILVTIVTGIALGVPPMLGVGVYSQTEEGELINMNVCMPNYLHISPEGLFLYWQIVTSLFGLLILTIIILYMLIFTMVYKHSTRINNQNASSSRMTSTQSKQNGRGTNVPPFIGFSRSERPKTLSVNTSKIPRKTFLQGLFRSNKKAKAKTNNQIITIKIVENSTTSNSVSLQKNNQNLLQVNRDSQKSPEPGTSGFPQIKHLTSVKKDNEQKNKTKSNVNDIVFQSHDEICNNPANQKLGIPVNQHSTVTSTNQKQANQRLDIPITQNAAVTSTNQKQDNQKLDIPITHNAAVTSTNQKQALPMKNRSAHIKTTKVLCLITTVYIIAFLPMFLITHKALEHNEILFYFYFINNAANPVIYSFMNRKFRQDIWKMFSCKSNAVWAG